MSTTKTVLVGVVVGIVLGFGAFAARSHFKEMNYVNALKNGGCVNIGPPPADFEFAPFIKDGFNCGGSLILALPK